MKTKQISEFFQKDYVDFASYDNLRKIASYIDGQKNAARKVLYTILEKSIKEELKVSQLSSKAGEFSSYLHGNLDGVIINLAQKFVGTNNVPLLTSEGSFGTRFIQEAAATRYIYTAGNKDLFKLFNKEDNKVLIKQEFEGEAIEPLFYVPNLPIILLNGSEGISSGFAQKILPRNPKKVKQYIIDFLSNSLRPRKENSLEPYFEGFRGTIESTENPKQWKIKGLVDKTTKDSVLITELPIGYELQGYLKVLRTLQEKKVINSFKDFSENDIFKFEVTFPSGVLNNMSQETLLEKLKLVKSVTENYTCMDENNKIVVFENVRDLINAYINVKLKFLGFRKDNSVSEMIDNLDVLKYKAYFISSVIKGEILVNNKSKQEIITQIEQNEKIKKVEDSYDYLLRMPIYSLTKEKVQEIKEQITDTKNEIDTLKNTPLEEIWKGDL